MNAITRQLDKLRDDCCYLNMTAALRAERLDAALRIAMDYVNPDDRECGDIIIRHRIESDVLAILKGEKET